MEMENLLPIRGTNTAPPVLILLKEAIMGAEKAFYLLPNLL